MVSENCECYDSWPVQVHVQRGGRRRFQNTGAGTSTGTTTAGGRGGSSLGIPGCEPVAPPPSGPSSQPQPPPRQPASPQPWGSGWDQVHGLSLTSGPWSLPHIRSMVSPSHPGCPQHGVGAWAYSSVLNRAYRRHAKWGLDHPDGVNSRSRAPCRHLVPTVF